MKVEFLPAAAEDAKVIAALRQGIWAATYRGIYPDEVIDNFDFAWHEERDRVRIMAEGFTVCLIRADDETVGYLILDDRGERPRLQSLYVLPDYQRQGIGRKALALMEEHCRALGATGFVLSCNPHNENACRFYETMGGAVIYADVGHENRQEDGVIYQFDVR